MGEKYPLQKLKKFGNPQKKKRKIYQVFAPPERLDNFNESGYELT